MPLAKIEIEQIEGNRWVAEVEAGTFESFKRHHMTGRSYAEIREAVDRVMCPESAAVEPEAAGVAPAPVAEAPAADALDAFVMAENESDTLREWQPPVFNIRPGTFSVDVRSEGERRANVRDADNEREALTAVAEARGIEVDRRWGLARLREAVRNV